jgi:hypothetical protein
MTCALNPPPLKLPVASTKGVVAAGQDTLVEAAHAAIACAEGITHNQIVIGDAHIEATTAAQHVASDIPAQCTAAVILV